MAPGLSVLVASFTVAGELDSFAATFNATAFAANLQALSPGTPIGSIQMGLSAASVLIEVRIIYRSADGASTSRDSISAMSVERLTAALNVPLEGAPSLSVEPATLDDANRVEAGGGDGDVITISDALSGSGAGMAGLGTAALAGIIAGVSGTLLLACCVLCLWCSLCRHRRGPRARRGMTVDAKPAPPASTLHMDFGGGSSSSSRTERSVNMDAMEKGSGGERLHSCPPSNPSLRSAVGGASSRAAVGHASSQRASSYKAMAEVEVSLVMEGEEMTSDDPPPAEGIQVEALWADGTLPADLRPGKAFTPFAPLAPASGKAGKAKARKEKAVTGLELACYHTTRCYGEDVPSVLVMLWCGIVHAKGGLATEGLFRLAGDQKQCDLAEKSMAKGTLPKNTEPAALAHLIKAFLRKLPTGLLGKLPSDVITECNSDAACGRLMAALEPPERAVLCWLIRVVCETAEHVDMNKMDVRNLTLVLAPNLFGPPNASANPMEELMLIKAATTTLHNLVESARKGAASRAARAGQAASRGASRGASQAASRGASQAASRGASQAASRGASQGAAGGTPAGHASSIRASSYKAMAEVEVTLASAGAPTHQGSLAVNGADGGDAPLVAVCSDGTGEVALVHPAAPPPPPPDDPPPPPDHPAPPPNYPAPPPDYPLLPLSVHESITDGKFMVSDFI